MTSHQYVNDQHLNELYVHVLPDVGDFVRDVASRMLRVADRGGPVSFLTWSVSIGSGTAKTIGGSP